MILPKRDRIIKPPGIILNNPKYSHNVAAAIRACSCFGISTLVWTGKRVDPTTMERLPREERMKGYKDVYWEVNERPFDALGKQKFVCVEIVPNAQNLVSFDHPAEAVYVFGPEDGGVSQVYKRFCSSFIFIPSAHCLNLSAALNVVLYDRRAKRINSGLESQDWNPGLAENRGSQIDIPGWDGK